MPARLARRVSGLAEDRGDLETPNLRSAEATEDLTRMSFGSVLSTRSARPEFGTDQNTPSNFTEALKFLTA